MTPGIASLVFGFLILGLFWLDRDGKTRTSASLWIPVIWLALSGSRSVSQWLDMGPVMSVDQLVEGSPLDRLVYMSLLTAGLFVIVHRRRRVGRLLSANRPIVVFFLYCVVSLLWSDFPGVAFKRWIKASGDFVMVLVVLSEREPTLAIKTLLSRTAYLLIPPSVLFIRYYPDLGRAYDPWEGTARYIGVTTNKNTLGVICLIFGLAMMCYLIAAYRARTDSGGNRPIIAYSIILVMIMWLLWMANSMSSLGSFLLTGALLFVTTLRGVIRRPQIVHALVFVILTACISILLLGLGSSVLTTMGRNPTLTDRTDVWAVVLGMAANPLVGTGFESYWLGPRLEKIWRVYQWGPTQAHNGYIEIFLNLGWAGLVLLSAVMATGYRTVTDAVRRNRPQASLMLAYFVMGLVYNFTEAAFFRMMAPAWIVTLLAITGDPEVHLSKGAPPLRSEPVLNEWFDLSASKIFHSSQSI